MVFRSDEGSFEVPVTDIVSYSFDKQLDFDDNLDILLDIDDDGKLNTNTYKKLVRRLIAGLKAFGLRNGDSVLCHLPNSIYCPAIFMSIVGAGGIWTPSNPANRCTEIYHFLELAEPVFIMTTKDTLPAILEGSDKFTDTEHQIFVVDFDDMPHLHNIPSQIEEDSEVLNVRKPVRPFNDLFLHGEEDWRTFNEKAQTLSPAVYFPTSGTTGLPKLAMVSHANLIAHHEILHQKMPFDVIRLISLPMFHLFATSFIFIQPLRYGQKTYVQKRFHLDRFLQSLQKYKITETYLPPPSLNAIINAKNVRPLMSSFRHIGTGAAPVSAQAIEEIRMLLSPGATVSCMWGMTEIGIVTSFRYGDNDDTGSVGRLMRGVEARLRKADGTIVESGNSAGELQIRCDGIMLGYRKIDLPEDEKIWVSTGDIGCFRDGKLYCIGRTKELIKAKGWQVAPAELEAVLLQHPRIADAAVAGVLLSDGISEAPRAYVVERSISHSEKSLLSDEIYRWCRVRLASYKALDGGIQFVEQIPRTASGKIQRAKLKLLDDLRAIPAPCSEPPDPQHRPLANELAVSKNGIAAQISMLGMRQLQPIAETRISPYIDTDSGLKALVGTLALQKRD